MTWHRPKHKQQPQRAKDELWWDTLDSTSEVVMQGKSHIRGWLLRLDEDNWVARSEDGSVRVEFNNIEEAKDFLWAIVHMEKRDG